MQAPETGSDFFELLEKSGLLSRDQILRVRNKLSLTQAQLPQHIASTLVIERILTPFQAERILEGRYRGLVIDGYRIREVLGFGGMGCVYIAEEPGGDQKVAIKVLSTEHALDAGMLARLKLEAIAGMKIRHPGIIRTHHLASTGAVHYLVMDLVRGISLHELVALHGPLKYSMACDIGLQAAEALHVAHQAGIIHRDIKPANFLVEASGQARVLDFGLAMIADTSDDEFSLSMVFGHDCLGTPDYISPEQSLDSRKVDPRADIYSLGATLFVALTGRVPFAEKSNKAKLEAQRTRPVRNVCELQSEIPAEVGAIILHMMEKDPARRFQTAAEVAEAFRPFAIRKTIQFDFRELITLRAKQAKAKANSTARKSSAPRSSITNTADWLRSEGLEIQSGDSFASAETPAARIQPSEVRKKSPSTAESSKGTVRNSAMASRSQLPTGWRLRITGKRELLPLVKSRNSVGTRSGSDVQLSGDGIDELQGRIEHHDGAWRYHHESRRFPSLLAGQPCSEAVLAHGARLTFGKRIDVTLLGPGPMPTQRRWLLWLLLLLLATISAVVAVLALRPDLL
jgi:serine/threonine protein kinase